MGRKEGTWVFFKGTREISCPPSLAELSVSRVFPVATKPILGAVALPLPVHRCVFYSLA